METMNARSRRMLCDDGPFREPDRSSARNNGRARAMTAGELPESGRGAGVPGGGARQAPHAPLPDCEVRVAQEADLCRRPSLARGVFAATFTRTFNMVQVEGSVCCCRCGLGLFPFDAKDPALLTLPLYWGGQQSLQDGAAHHGDSGHGRSPIFDDEYRKGRPRHAAKAQNVCRGDPLLYLTARWP